MTVSRSDWESLVVVFENVAKDRPSVGCTVKVVKGRKHVGETGKVAWHGKDKYLNMDRYQTDVQVALADAIGKIGYRVRIQPEYGEAFFVSAEYVEVQHT
jgi:hypothetical protein